MSRNSTLDPDNLPIPSDRSRGLGHGIGTLGPSDTSDSGSDMQIEKKRKNGHRNFTQEDTEDLHDSPMEESSDSDSRGTGERASVEHDDVDADAADIDVDHIETIQPG